MPRSFYKIKQPRRRGKGKRRTAAFDGLTKFGKFAKIRLRDARFGGFFRAVRVYVPWPASKSKELALRIDSGSVPPIEAGPMPVTAINRRRVAATWGT